MLWSAAQKFTFFAPFFRDTINPIKFNLVMKEIAVLSAVLSAIFSPTMMATAALAATVITPFVTTANAAGSVGVADTLPVLEVISSKIPVDINSSPAMITIVTGKELHDRNARDLRTALSLVAGVDIAPGGDAGPASSVPGLWGLREFDAFLLVVDGVPSGGAFNPALTTLDLNNVKQIEVLRGAAPVMYGATSFVGVINVIHYPAGEMPREASLSIGSRNTVNVSFSTNLSAESASHAVRNQSPNQSLQQSLSANVSTQQFSQDAAKLGRAHLLYRAAFDNAWGKVHLDFDATALRQRPYSPHPVEEGLLTPRFPLDANANPRDARADQNRVQLNIGLEKSLPFGIWNTLISFARAENHNIRGYLRPEFSDDGVIHNVDGYRQSVTTAYGYIDTYLASKPIATVNWTNGFDFLYGNGRQQSDNFEYAVLPSGANRPLSTSLEIDESTMLRDRRNFAGLYSQLNWRPDGQTDGRWNFLLGLRYNDTRESRDGEAVDHHATPGTPNFIAVAKARKTGLTGTLAASYALWIDQANRLTAFANYRDSYKPAAIDFGPEAEGTILKPETAKSAEVGFKGRALDGRLDWEISFFRMRFKNLVIRENIGGLPSLANAGQEKFSGVEAEAAYRFSDALMAKGSAAHHRARYTDYAVAQGDGSLQSFSGNRLEASPDKLASLGIIYAPLNGPGGSVVWNYVGSRFLDRENMAPAGAYTTVDAGLSYRFADWDFRIDGRNITNRRDPVAVSELGEGQYYRLPGRTYFASAKINF